MKKIVSVLLCSLMLLSLFSCEITEGENDLNTPTQTDSQPSKETDDNEENDGIVLSEAERAMEMYKAAIKGEIYVVDEQFGEISLKDCRFLTNNVTVGECEILNNAILDMDGDGINEYVIQSGDEADHIVLRYYEGKIYSYSFGITEFRHLNTNGTFFWSFGENNMVCGLNRLVFNGSSISIEKMYEVNIDYDNTYYIEGKQVTYEELRDQYDYYKDCIVRKSFSPLEIDCPYPISSERALEIASGYWGVSDWDYDCAMGTTIADRIVLSSKPNDENGYYRIIWKLEYYWHAYPCWEGQTPSATATHIYKEVTVDAFTGECRQYTEYLPDGKG